MCSFSCFLQKNFTALFIHIHCNCEFSLCISKAARSVLSREKFIKKFGWIKKFCWDVFFLMELQRFLMKSMKIFATACLAHFTFTRINSWFNLHSKKRKRNKSNLSLGKFQAINLDSICLGWKIENFHCMTRVKWQRVDKWIFKKFISVFLTRAATFGMWAC